MPGVPLLCCVSGSRALGMGHVIRSLRLTLELETHHGIEGYFAGRWEDGADGPLWRRHPLRLQRFQGPEAVPHDQLEWFADRIRAQVVLLDLLLDPERDTPFLARQQARGRKLVTLHEHAFPWAPVDLAVNPSVLEQAVDTSVQDTRLSLQGLDYLLLDPAYAEPSTQTRDPQHLAIVLGGADPGGHTARVVGDVLATERFRDWHITVIQGPAMADLVLPADPRFELVQNPPSLVQLFQQVSLAITNGGTTCYEALAAGCPVLGLAQNPFEAKVIARLETLGLLRPYSLDALATVWLAPPPRRIDGRGVERAASAIAGFVRM